MSKFVLVLLQNHAQQALGVPKKNGTLELGGLGTDILVREYLGYIPAHYIRQNTASGH